MCTNGWVCEHRWREIRNMVKFRAITNGTIVENWWDNGSNQIAFSRGDRGFMAFNNDNSDMIVRVKTKLKAGHYCDIISGDRLDRTCTGNVVVIKGDGTAMVRLSQFDGVLAIHIEVSLPFHNVNVC